MHLVLVDSLDCRLEFVQKIVFVHLIFIEDKLNLLVFTFIPGIEIKMLLLVVSLRQARFLPMPTKAHAAAKGCTICICLFQCRSKTLLIHTCLIKDVHGCLFTK